eukprot:TRINITY_DN23047_c0_g1_i1.p1 TRINITY_DN23047_c0_g1~~TRINITY_DN23047_c0_g1_i1.p1  ORF type:complete len:109 (-),score=20.56 TRINITY_DN23047_c0_g1_i1:22-348(-)
MIHFSAMFRQPSVLLYLLERGLNTDVKFKAFSAYNGKTAEKIAHMEQSRDIMKLFEQWNTWKMIWPKSHRKFSKQRQMKMEEMALILHYHSIPNDLVILTILQYLKFN